MTQYIYELPDWPKFRWDHKTVADQLAALRFQQGRLVGRMQGLGFSLRGEANLHTLTENVIKSSEIEGEFLNRDQVRSSVARRLGIDIGGLMPADRHVDGVVELMLDATQKYDRPLTAERLFGWHAALFPTGHSGLQRINVGVWRDDKTGPMQVVSGPVGHQQIHYEAPGAARLDRETTAFLNWFNAENDIDLIVKAAIAHLWFVTIHPFDDGNGRMARAIADMALARADQSAQRFYSMSVQIQQERRTYYNMLEATQKGDLDITNWLDWFLACLDRAVAGAEHILASVLGKAKFWGQHAGAGFNDRQREMLNRLLNGLEGKLTTSKWAKIEKCSQDTALRDISNLVDRGILLRAPAGGRSTSYSLADV